MEKTFYYPSMTGLEYFKLFKRGGGWRADKVKSSFFTEYQRIKACSTIGTYDKCAPHDPHNPPNPIRVTLCLRQFITQLGWLFIVWLLHFDARENNKSFRGELDYIGFIGPNNRAVISAFSRFAT